MKVVKVVKAVITKQNETDITEEEFDKLTMDIIRLVESMGMGMTSHIVLEDDDNETEK